MLLSSFEFAEFENIYFRRANFSMDYSEFNHIKINHVILPFTQLPFIFGGLDYLFPEHKQQANPHLAIPNSQFTLQFPSLSIPSCKSQSNTWITFIPS